MAKRKDARVTAILMRSGVKKVLTGISIYITQEPAQYAQSIRIEKILSLLLQTYDSWGNKEIDRTKYVLSPKTERLHYI